jgi:putative oxidoreductase
MDRTDIAKLLLRVVVGVLLLYHGVDKIINGIGGVKTLVDLHGLPSFVAYGVYVGEIIAPIFLIVGWRGRLWAGVIVFNMMMAIYFAHWANLFALSQHGGLGIELPLFYLVVSVVIILLGEGRYSISGRSDQAPFKAKK